MHSSSKTLRLMESTKTSWLSRIAYRPTMESRLAMPNLEPFELESYNQGCPQSCITALKARNEIMYHYNGWKAMMKHEGMMMIFIDFTRIEIDFRMKLDRRYSHHQKALHVLLSSWHQLQRFLSAFSKSVAELNLLLSFSDPSCMLCCSSFYFSQFKPDHVCVRFLVCYGSSLLMQYLELQDSTMMTCRMHIIDQTLRSRHKGRS